MKSILITCPRVEISKSKFNKIFASKNIKFKYIFPEGQSFTSNQLKNLYSNYEIMIVGDDQVDAEFLKTAKSLNYIIKWGKGIDNIDQIFCNKKNITIKNSPGDIAKYVAEHGLAMIHSLNKKLEVNKISILKGEWYKEVSYSLYNQTVGFYGFGNVAGEMVKLLTPYNTKVLYYDIFQKKSNHNRVELNELFSASDIIVVSAELTDDNIGEINLELFKMMKIDSLLINVSRGKIINETDLIFSLKNQLFRGAGLDVFENEPLDKDNELLKLNNALLTCHNASNTNEASFSVNENIIKILGEIL